MRQKNTKYIQLVTALMISTTLAPINSWAMEGQQNTPLNNNILEGATEDSPAGSDNPESAPDMFVAYAQSPQSSQMHVNKLIFAQCSREYCDKRRALTPEQVEECSTLAYSVEWFLDNVRKGLIQEKNSFTDSDMAVAFANQVKNTLYIDLNDDQDTDSMPGVYFQGVNESALFGKSQQEVKNSLKLRTDYPAVKEKINNDANQAIVTIVKKFHASYEKRTAEPIESSPLESSSPPPTITDVTMTISENGLISTQVGGRDSPIQTVSSPFRISGAAGTYSSAQSSENRRAHSPKNTPNPETPEAPRTGGRITPIAFNLEGSESDQPAIHSKLVDSPSSPPENNSGVITGQDEWALQEKFNIDDLKNELKNGLKKNQLKGGNTRTNRRNNGILVKNILKIADTASTKIKYDACIALARALEDSKYTTRSPGVNIDNLEELLKSQRAADHPGQVKGDKQGDKPKEIAGEKQTADKLTENIEKPKPTNKGEAPISTSPGVTAALGGDNSVINVGAITEGAENKGATKDLAPKNGDETLLTESPETTTTITAGDVGSINVGEKPQEPSKPSQLPEKTKEEVGNKVKNATPGHRKTLSLGVEKKPSVAEGSKRQLKLSADSIGTKNSDGKDGLLKGVVSMNDSFTVGESRTELGQAEESQEEKNKKIRLRESASNNFNKYEINLALTTVFGASNSELFTPSSNQTDEWKFKETISVFNRRMLESRSMGQLDRADQYEGVCLILSESLKEGKSYEETLAANFDKKEVSNESAPIGSVSSSLGSQEGPDYKNPTEKEETHLEKLQNEKSPPVPDAGAVSIDEEANESDGRPQEQRENLLKLQIFDVKDKEQKKEINVTYLEEKLKEKLGKEVYAAILKSRGRHQTGANQKIIKILKKLGKQSDESSATEESNLFKVAEEFFKRKENINDSPSSNLAKFKKFLIKNPLVIKEEQTPLTPDQGNRVKQENSPIQERVVDADSPPPTPVIMSPVNANGALNALPAAVKLPQKVASTTGDGSLGEEANVEGDKPEVLELNLSEKDGNERKVSVTSSSDQATGETKLTTDKSQMHSKSSSLGSLDQKPMVDNKLTLSLGSSGDGIDTVFAQGQGSPVRGHLSKGSGNGEENQEEKNKRDLFVNSAWQNLTPEDIKEIVGPETFRKLIDGSAQVDNQVMSAIDNKINQFLGFNQGYMAEHCQGLKLILSEANEKKESFEETVDKFDKEKVVGNKSESGSPSHRPGSGDKKSGGKVKSAQTLGDVQPAQGGGQPVVPVAGATQTHGGVQPAQGGGQPVVPVAGATQNRSGVQPPQGGGKAVDPVAGATQTLVSVPPVQGGDQTVVPIPGATQTLGGVQPPQGGGKAVDPVAGATQNRSGVQPPQGGGKAVDPVAGATQTLVSVPPVQGGGKAVVPIPGATQTHGGVQPPQDGGQPVVPVAGVTQTHGGVQPAQGGDQPVVPVPVATQARVVVPPTQCVVPPPQGGDEPAQRPAVDSEEAFDESLRDLDEYSENRDQHRRAAFAPHAPLAPMAPVSILEQTMKHEAQVLEEAVTAVGNMPKHAASSQLREIRTKSLLKQSINTISGMSKQMAQKFMNLVQQSGQPLAEQFKQLVKASPKRNAHDELLHSSGGDEKKPPISLRNQIGNAGFWVQQGGQMASLHIDKNRGRQKLIAGSTVVGADYAVNNCLTIGLLGAFGYAKVSKLPFSGKGEIKSYHGGVYASWIPTDKSWYIDVQGLFGQHHYSRATKQGADAGALSGLKVKGKVTELSANTEIGAIYPVSPDTFFQPYVQAGYTYHDYGKVKAQSPLLGDHTVSLKGPHFVDVGVGMEISRLISMKESILRPSLRVGYVHHQLTSSKSKGSMADAANPGKLKITDFAKTRGAFNGDLNLSVLSKNGVAFSFGYHTELGRKIQNHEGLLRVSVLF